jgi:hypothetical protein
MVGRLISGVFVISVLTLCSLGHTSARTHTAGTRQELLGHVGFQQAVAILRERGRVLHIVVQVQLTKQRNRMLQSISSISKRSLRIEYNICSNCARNSFSGGMDGRPAQAYIESNRRDKLGEHFVHHDPDGAQGMVLPHARFRRQVTEHVIPPLVCSSHVFS